MNAAPDRSVMKIMRIWQKIHHAPLGGSPLGRRGCAPSSRARAPSASLVGRGSAAASSQAEAPKHQEGLLTQ